jgi:predicted transcriptional regulator
MATLETSEKVREALRRIPRAEWDALAADSGVPRSTIEKIAYGVTANPSFDSMVGIVEALRRRETKTSDRAVS